MARRRKGRKGTAVKVKGYSQNRKGKLVRVKAYSRKRPKKGKAVSPLSGRGYKPARFRI